MSSFSYRPLAFWLAVAFPVAASAAPTVAASGDYNIVALPDYSWLVTAKSGSFNQSPTSGAFNQSAVGDKQTPYDSYAKVAAYSDGAGHFGGSVDNDILYGAISPQTGSVRLLFSDTITNNSEAASNAVFNLNISGLQFAFRAGTMFDSSINRASFSALVQANGNTVWSSGFTANPLLQNPSTGEGGVAFQSTGSDIGLQNQAAATNCRIFSDCGFAISGYSQALNLGVLAPHQSMTVTYAVDLRTETDTYGGTSSIYFNDPAGLSVDSPVSGGVHLVSAVPEPESAAMMAVGLGLLGAVAGRRRRRC